MSESRRIDRRDFVAGSSSALFASCAARRFAGPFVQDGDFPIPADKKLDPAWLRSLFARGEPGVVSGDALRFIGMPVGGLFAGTVYLGGDGRLWNWDIFNEQHEGGVARKGVTYRGRRLREREGANYVDPPEQRAPFDFGVTLVAGGKERSLDRHGWSDVRFRGEYPVGRVDYADPSCPLDVHLTAFSPFVPLDVDESSYPATVLRYTLKNAGDGAVRAELRADFDNPVLVHSRGAFSGVEIASEDRSAGDRATVLCSAKRAAAPRRSERPDVVFEDFESGTYDGWKVDGTAFGKKPRSAGDIASYQGDLHAAGKHCVNSHETRNGEDVRAGDRHTGSMTSRAFVIGRRYINFRIGGGRHPGRTCLDLVVGGKTVRSATGRNENAMHAASFDVAELEGERAQLRIVDSETGAWGNVGIDAIVFSDAPHADRRLEEARDYGTFCVSCIGSGGSTKPGLSSRVGRSVVVPAGGTVDVTFIVAWHFPNVRIPRFRGKKRWYASRFADALAVAAQLAGRLAKLTELTLTWNRTWYDSTLPYWLLDRTMIPTDALATNTCHRLDDGRFWFWEGIGCCAGTCTHVWGYAQAIGRLFPEVERYLREQIDYGLAFHADTGAIDYRAEVARSVAHDGQCGCILRAYREHLMSAGDAFLRRIWPAVKRSIEFMIAQDADRDGLLEGAQYNTLDAAWYGPMAWLSSLFLAALRAGAKMAAALGDRDFAARCDAIVARGSKAIVAKLYNGEYFIHLPDPNHPEANSTNQGCHIDQVYGQAWAFEVGLGRVVPAAETRKALRALWTYNFAPDVGVYRDWMKTIKGGRWYAVPGEAGLLMCTFPHGGAERATGKGGSKWAAMYMNECMTGFEYQAAAHMVWEGLVLEGLAVTRAIHDRYAPVRRNPYNEIECSDHYGRAMAAYGVFLAACGFDYDGPRGALAFAPRIRPGDFRAPFTAAEGWGTLAQQRSGDRETASVEVRHGRLRIGELTLAVERAADEVRAAVVRTGKTTESVAATTKQGTAACLIRFAQQVRLEAGDRLEVTLG